MEVFARHLGDVKFAVETRGHTVICDQPLDNGGADSGMTPPEFLLVSLASCAGFYAAQYLKARGLTAELGVKVSAEKAAQPARLSAFHIVVSAPGLEERHQTGILRAVKSCLIHNTLLAAPEIDIAIDTGKSPAGTPVMDRAA